MRAVGYHHLDPLSRHRARRNRLDLRSQDLLTVCLPSPLHVLAPK